MHTPQDTRVLLLEGGWNSEKEVSLSSGASVYESLTKQGYTIKRINPTRDIKALLNQMEAFSPHVVFNALHGLYFEDGRLQGLLDLLQVPYTHSNAFASALAMHKPTAKKFALEAGVPTPRSKLVHWDNIKDQHPLPCPYVVKPVDEGSSVGVYIIQEGDAPLGNTLVHWPFGGDILVEEYIPGQEISVAIFNNKAMGILELRPKEGFYDYKAKYTDGLTEHIMPAELPQEAYETTLRYGEKIHTALGCSGITRADFRYNPENNTSYFIELNTQPGFTSLSILPEICAHQGVSFDEIVNWLIEDALCRHKNP